MCDSGRRKTDRQLPWLKVGLDGTELPLSASCGTHKWRVRGWVGGLCVKLKEVGMDGKGTLKMFTRKKRELIKTPSISKKSRAGSPGAQSGAQAVSNCNTSVFFAAAVRVCVCVVSDDLQLDGTGSREGSRPVCVSACVCKDEFGWNALVDVTA